MRLSNSENKPIGRVPPSAFGMWVVTEVLIDGATSPLAKATLASFSASRRSLAGKTRSPRSLKKVTGSGALWAGAKKKLCASVGVRAFVKSRKR